MQNRDQLRQTFFDAWNKYKENQSLTALEQQIVELINMHPEYQALFNGEADIAENFTTDNNPYLHLSLHLGLIEQVSTNRPAGINAIFKKLVSKTNDPHQSAHLMMDVMANILWDAQQSGVMPDEQTYLEKINRLV